MQYKLTYDPSFLSLQSVVDGSFKGSPGACMTTATPGVVAVYCTRYSPELEVNNPAGETISTITFKATGAGLTLNGPWTTYLDLSTNLLDLSSGAKGGIKVFVNNGGFGAPSSDAGHTITDADDGKVTISGLANFTGYIDLEGRANDSGATLTAYNQQAIFGSVAYASGVSASSGKFTTSYLATYQLTVPTTYYFQVDAPLFLPTTAVATSPSYPSLPTLWPDSLILSDRPLTSMKQVKLLGGDAVSDNVIGVSDLGCIAGAYGGLATNCSGLGSSDVNGDGVVNIYDLVLVGGNFDLTSSPWTP